jgi:uncharacterized membrane protein
VVAVYGHLTTTEELLMQQKSSDQWSFYQAKALRRYQSEVAQDLMKAIPGEAAAKTAEKYGANFERYEKEADKIQEQANEYAKESEHAGRRALRLHLGEIFLELAIVFLSLAILARKNVFWLAGIGSATLGAVVSATVFFVAR